MIDYNNYKEYLIKIGFADNSLNTYPSYVSENKIKILGYIDRYKNLSDENKLIMFSNEDNSFQKEFDKYHTFKSESTFNDLRSGARRFKYYLQYKKIIQTIRKYKNNPDFFSLNNATYFFKIFNNNEQYPIKVIVRENLDILELHSSFTTNDAKRVLKNIFNKQNKENIIFTNTKDIIIQSQLKITTIKTKNILLYGSPGVGKTHNTKKIITLIEEKELSEKEIFETIKNNSYIDNVDISELKDRVKFITFHQSFGYEDFIEGFRPNADGNITLQDGIFKTFCSIASKDIEQNYYLIIDEINRGNISKIFGELITLIEEDKRDILEITLPYSKKLFKIPSNLYIIGTMNTTDKSIALIDIALRRRFTFLKMQPNAKLIKFPPAKTLFETLNTKIKESIGEDYLLGHSYFMNIQDKDDLDFILEYKIKPLLEEYFYGDDRLEDILKIWS